LSGRRVLPLAAAAVAVLCLTPAIVNARMSFGFYTNLRWVVMLAAGTCAFHLQSNKAAMVALAVLGVLFNPFEPIHLGRDTWRVLDVAAAGVFIWAAWTTCERRP